jgi:cyanoexosortase B-associated protein
MLSIRKSLQISWSKIVLLMLLLSLVVMGALPGYLSGKWRWTAPPSLTTLTELKDVRKSGLAVPNWPTLSQEILQIGDHKWSKQVITDGSNRQVTLLLFTQNGPKDQPQVEWMDIRGAWNWQADLQREVNFAVEQPQANVTAQFFRGWTKQKTCAVLQWYAWPGGGHHAPSRWFLADRLAQWHNRRVPWVAVSILVPIEPLDDIEKYWPQVKALGQTVQAALMSSTLRPH